MIKTVSLDLHDFSVLNNRLDLLKKIKEHYPDFKVSLFTIPFHFVYETNMQARLGRGESLKAIKENLDWMQLMPHGISHMEREFENVTYREMKDLMLPAIAEAFDKDGLPYEKGFIAPYWLWNEGVCKALDEAGWWGGVDRNQLDMPRAKKTYTYTHGIEEPFWKSTNETLKLHGHIDGVSANDLEACFLNIFKLPPDVEWRFVTDFIDE